MDDGSVPVRNSVLKLCSHGSVPLAHFFDSLSHSEILTRTVRPQQAQTRYSHISDIALPVVRSPFFNRGDHRLLSPHPQLRTHSATLSCLQMRAGHRVSSCRA